MPAPLKWTEPRDTTLRRMRHERRSWDEIGVALEVSRGAAIERGRKIGAPFGPVVVAFPAAAVRSSAPLPPGHEISWGLLTVGTVLEGMDYPTPVAPIFGKALAHAA